MKDTRWFWRFLYGLIGRDPPAIKWTNGYAICWFSKGWNPNKHGKKYSSARWWRK